MMNPKWNNVLDTINSKKIWAGGIHDALLAAISVGYDYILWDDGKIFTYSLDKHGNVVVEPTELTVEDISFPAPSKSNT